MTNKTYQTLEDVLLRNEKRIVMSIGRVEVEGKKFWQFNSQNTGKLHFSNIGQMFDHIRGFNLPVNEELINDVCIAQIEGY